MPKFVEGHSQQKKGKKAWAAPFDNFYPDSPFVFSSSKSCSTPEKQQKTEGYRKEVNAKYISRFDGMSRKRC